MGTLADNAAARGAARAAGIPIVNARPVTTTPTTQKGTSVVPSVLSTPSTGGIGSTATKPVRTAAQDAQAAHEALIRSSQVGVNPYADFIQKNVITNFDPSGLSRPDGTTDYTPEQIQNHYLALALADPDVWSTRTKVAGAENLTVNNQSGDVIKQNALKRLTEKYNFSPEEALKTVNAQLPQIQSTMSNTGLGGTFDPKTGMFVAPSDVGASARARLAAIDARMKELNKPLQFEGLYSYLDNQKAAEFSAKQEQEKSALAKEREDLISGVTSMQNAGKVNIPNASSDSSLPKNASQTSDQNPADSMPGSVDPITKMQGTDLARIKTATTPLDSAIQDAMDKALETKNEGLSLIDKPDESGYADEKANIKKAFDDKLKFNAEVDRLARDRAVETERAALAANDRARELAGVENAKSELDQQKLNVENELVARRSINKLGGGHDYSGLRYIQKTVQDGIDSLNYIRAKAATMEGEFGDKAVHIINTFALDMRSLDLSSKKDYSDAYNTYIKELKDAKKDFNATKKEIREATYKVHKDYSDTLTQLDLKKGEMIKEISLKHMDNMNSLAKLRIQMQHQDIGNAIKMLAMATKKGVKMSPEAMATFEKQVAPNLPPGWMKFAQGDGGAGAGYKVWTPEGLSAAQVWLSKQPGRSFTDLTPSDQQWLVPMSQPIPGSGDNIAQWMGPGAKIVDNQPKTGFDAERPKEPASSTYVKEYDTIVERTGKPPIGSDGKPMSLQDYFAQRGFNPMLQAPSTPAPRRTDVQEQPVDTSASDEAALEEWLYSDPDTFDFNSDIP